MEQDRNFEINYKRVTVKMSDGLLYSGKVNIRNFQRLSDFFRQTEDHFLVVISDSGDPGEPAKVMMLNKQYITWAETTD